MTLLEKLDRLEPLVCRMMARSNGHFMSDREIMQVTGWGIAKLRRIYNSKSWARINVRDVDVFLKACGISWSSQRRILWLLKLNAYDITKMRHLQFRTGWQAAMILRHQRRILRLLEDKDQ